MKLTARVKLLTTPEQFAGLKDTLKTANAACNYLSQLAWDSKTFEQYNLHKLGYHNTRERFKLSAQVVVRCISKVTDAYKLDKKSQCTFKPLGSIAFDARILTWKLDRHEVSIWTTAGRQTILFSSGERQRDLLKTQQGESDLVLINGEFYLFATCNVPEPTPEDIEGVLGVDLGIVQLATTSDGDTQSGSHVKSVRHRRLRTKLQSKGTKSAKRKLKKLSGRERRFQNDVNHCLSKKLVDDAKRTKRVIALEELKGIRQRIRAKKAHRATLHSWAFAELINKVLYKAKLAGVEVVFVDPRNTSRECSKCSYTAKANRPSQSVFRCLQCGTSLNADANAALVIRGRAYINRPNAVGNVSKSAHATPQLQARDF